MRTEIHSKPCRGTIGAAAFLAAALIGFLLGPARASADSVSLSWTAPGDDGMTGRAASYELRYSENPVAADTAAWWSSATPVGTLPSPHMAGTPESFIVTGLDSGTTLYFVIRSRDEVPNVSGYSNIAVKQTSVSVPLLATPKNFKGNVTPPAVLLTWNAVPSGGAEVGYRLYRKATTDPGTTLLKTLPLSASSWNDSTASAGSTYDFSLATYDAGGAEGMPATLRIRVPSPATPNIPVVHGYPNPARDLVTFELQVDATATQDARTRVTVYDLTGHRICILADEVFAPGQHALSWACRSDGGSRVAPGLYNVIVEGPSGRAVTRVAVVP